jgi:hypothetical protein
MLKNAAGKATGLTPITTDNVLAGSNGSRAVQLPSGEVLTYLGGNQGYFAAPAGSTYTNAAGGTVTSNGQYSTGLQQRDLTGSSLQLPNADGTSTTQKINTPADAQSAYLAMNDYLAGNAPANAMNSTAQSALAPNLNAAASTGDLTPAATMGDLPKADAGAAPTTQAPSTTQVPSTYAGIMAAVSAGGVQGNAIRQSEVARAQAKIASATAAGDTTSANAAQAYIEKLNSTAQAAWQKGGTSGTTVTTGQTDPTTGLDTGVQSSVASAVKSGDISSLISIAQQQLDAANTAASTAAANDTYSKQESDLMSKEQASANYDPSADLNTYVQQIMNNNSPLMASQKTTLDKQYNEAKRQAAAQADARGTFYSGAREQSTNDITDAESTAYNSFVTQLQSDANSQAANLVSAKVQQMGISRQAYADALSALQNDHTAALNASSEAIKTAQSYLLSLAGLQQTANGQIIEQAKANEAVRSDKAGETFNNAQLTEKTANDKASLSNAITLQSMQDATSRANNAASVGASRSKSGTSSSSAASLALQQARSVAGQYMLASLTPSATNKAHLPAVGELTNAILYGQTGITDKAQAQQIAQDVFTSTRATLPPAPKSTTTSTAKPTISSALKAAAAKGGKY